MSQFAETILGYVPASAGFRPYFHYDPDGDVLQFVSEADTYSGVRIDSTLTVYVSDEQPGKVIGGLFKDFKIRCKQLLEQLPGLSESAIEDNRVRIDEVLSAHLFLTTATDKRKSEYRKMAARTVRAFNEPVVEMSC